MPTLADVVRQHGRAYRARAGARLLPSHDRAMRDIEGCRTTAMGGHVEHCTTCGERHVVYHSCRNRACARCGAGRAALWVAKQQELLLPVPYFHVVFTLPAELRGVVRAHQKKLIAVLFRAAFESLSRVCADERHLGGKIGALAVLHTWTRTLEWHPHVHLLVPGGALRAGREWRSCRCRKSGEPYLVPVKALSLAFWGRFMHLARKALPHVEFPDLPRSKRWVVHAKPVLQGGRHVVDYLGRYINRTALSERALLSCNTDEVSFRYRDSRDGQHKLMSLPGQEFLRRYLQHVLPRGVHRVRSFGLLHPSHRVQLRRLQLLLCRERSRKEDRSEKVTSAPRRCTQCGGIDWWRGARLDPLECAAVVRAEQIARAPPHGESR